MDWTLWRSSLRSDADFGIAASELALHRARGRPVVALADDPELAAGAARQPTQDPEYRCAGRSANHAASQRGKLFAYLRREGSSNLPLCRTASIPDDLIEGRVDIFRLRHR